MSNKILEEMKNNCLRHKGSNIEDFSNWKYKIAPPVSILPYREVCPDYSQAIKDNIQPKQCYDNALRLINIIPDSKMVFGMATYDSLPFSIDYAWLSIDGKHIDPTWANIEGVEYVKIIEFTFTEISQIISGENFYDLALLKYFQNHIHN